MYILAFVPYSTVSWLLPPVVVATVTLFALKLINRLFPGKGKTGQGRPDTVAHRP